MYGEILLNRNSPSITNQQQILQRSMKNYKSFKLITLKSPLQLIERKMFNSFKKKHYSAESTDLSAVSVDSKGALTTCSATDSDAGLSKAGVSDGATTVGRIKGFGGSKLIA